MTIAMDELDVAFLPATGAPLWHPLEIDRSTGAGSTTADDVWTELALQIELDRSWEEIVSLLQRA